MIEVKNLYKSFDGNKMILNGINEKIENGEKESGITIHLVNNEYDKGQNIKALSRP